MMQIFRMPSSFCPRCGKACDHALPVIGENIEKPTPGTHTMCIGCGAWLVFDEQLLLRWPTPDELVSQTPEHRRYLAEMRKALKRVRARGH